MRARIIGGLALLLALAGCARENIAVAPGFFAQRLDEIIAIHASTNVANVLTGVSGDASSEQSDGAARGVGLLLIYETNGVVSALSTTGNSQWRGHFSNSLLTASYTHEGYDGAPSGTIQLTLSADGRELDGTWTGVHGNRGSYRAFRLRNPQLERVRDEFLERFGSSF